jgi:predicted nucleic acid-binding protein
VSLFVDTAAWYAAADVGDRSHTPALQALSRGERLLTSSHVLAETWNLIHHRLGWPAAERFWGGLRSGVAIVETVGAADLEAAWGIGQSFPDQDFSFVDRTSFAVMERLGIERVATFDEHFAIYRYGQGRKRAFTVVG